MGRRVAVELPASPDFRPLNTRVSRGLPEPLPTGPTPVTAGFPVFESGGLRAVGLVSDLAGTSGATEAWVTADHLTILLGYQSVTLQRS